MGRLYILVFIFSVVIALYLVIKRKQENRKNRDN